MSRQKVDMAKGPREEFKERHKKDRVRGYGVMGGLIGRGVMGDISVVYVECKRLIGVMCGGLG